MKQNMGQTGCHTIAACFPFEPLENCTTFEDIFQDFPRPWALFPGLSRTKVIFQDFPCPGIFKKKTQDFPGGVKTLMVSWRTGVTFSSHCLPAGLHFYFKIFWGSAETDL